MNIFIPNYYYYCYYYYYYYINIVYDNCSSTQVIISFTRYCGLPPTLTTTFKINHNLWVYINTCVVYHDGEAPPNYVHLICALPDN